MVAVGISGSRNKRDLLLIFHIVFSLIQCFALAIVSSSGELDARDKLEIRLTPPRRNDQSANMPKSQKSITS